MPIEPGGRAHDAREEEIQLPAWERIIATLCLGFGEQLESPRDHWSLRDPAGP